jgi:hypothetical protein
MKTLRIALGIIIILAGGFGSGYFYGRHTATTTATTTGDSSPILMVMNPTTTEDETPEANEELAVVDTANATGKQAIKILRTVKVTNYVTETQDGWEVGLRGFVKKISLADRKIYLTSNDPYTRGSTAPLSVKVDVDTKFSVYDYEIDVAEFEDIQIGDFVTITAFLTTEDQIKTLYLYLYRGDFTPPR